MSTYSHAYDGAMPAMPRRKRLRAALFGSLSLWLVLAMLIGISIAIYDGLNRDYIADIDALNLAEALTYEAHQAAWLFAGLTLPLMLLHGRKMRFSIPESIFLWFMLCTAAYSKDFAYMKVPGAPIYVTDVTLAIVTLGTFIWPRLRIPKPTSRVMLPVAAFLLLGAVNGVRGIQNHGAIIDVLRDVSVTVYSLFMLAGLYAKRRKALVEQFFLMILCGAIMATLVGIGWYLAHPGMRRYVEVQSYVALAFMLVTIAILGKRLSPLAGVPLLLLLAYGVILSNARTVYVGMGLGFGLLLLTGLGKLKMKDVLKFGGIAFLVLAIVFVALLQTREGSQYARRVVDELIQGFLHPSGDDNAQWRLLAWAEAGRRFLTQPVIGEGYGLPFTFELASMDIKPHNIYLYVLYKTGLVGFSIFLWLLIVPTLAAWRAMRKYKEHPDALAIRALFVCQIFFFCWGALNPLIETPFLASMFWLNFGLMLHTARQMERDSNALVSAAAA